MDKMTQEDAARIQSSQATSGQDTGKGSFASRAQSAGDRNADQAAENTQQQGHEGNGDTWDDDDTWEDDDNDGHEGEGDEDADTDDVEGDEDADTDDVEGDEDAVTEDDEDADTDDDEE